MTVNWIEWAYRLVIAALLGGNLFWIKRWIKGIEEWQKNHDLASAEDLKKWAEEGGIVTRNLWFEFCASVREKCPIFVLTKWRDGILDEGGVMTRKEAQTQSEKTEDKFFDRLQNLFEEHNKRVDAVLGGMKEGIKGNADLLALVVKRQGEVVNRIDNLYKQAGEKNG